VIARTRSSAPAGGQLVDAVVDLDDLAGRINGNNRQALGNFDPAE
jgi:hypothetical protein